MPDDLIGKAVADDAPLPKTPRPLHNESFIGDVVALKVRQNQPFKFVFKRKIYLRHLDEPGDDIMYERLIYLQVPDCFFQDECLLAINYSYRLSGMVRGGFGRCIG